jgi:hypothetical protein
MGAASRQLAIFFTSFDYGFRWLEIATPAEGVKTSR